MKNNNQRDFKLDESQAPKIPSQVEVNASKVLGDISGCPSDKKELPEEISMEDFWEWKKEYEDKEKDEK